MNTPTPEDFHLAERIDELSEVGAYGMACIQVDRAAQLIADHCAPLRELAEIGRLAVEAEKKWADPWAAPGAQAELEKAIKAYLAKEGK